MKDGAHSSATRCFTLGSSLLKSFFLYPPSPLAYSRSAFGTPPLHTQQHSYDAERERRRERARDRERERENEDERARAEVARVCVVVRRGEAAGGGQKKREKGSERQFLPSEKFVAARDCAQLVCLELRIRQLKQLPCWHRRACCYVSAARQTTVRQHVATPVGSKQQQHYAFIISRRSMQHMNLAQAICSLHCG